MNDIINKYKKNSSYKITNQPNTDIVNKYLQSGGNQLNYYNQARSQAQLGMNNLAQKKYASPELQAIEQNRALGNVANVDNAFNQAQAIYQNQAQSMSDLGVAKEQAEKYMPNQLQQAGLGNVGTSESSQIGIQNQYMRGVGGINQQAIQNLNEVQRQYLQNKMGIEQQYLSGVQEEERNTIATKQAQANNLLANATSLKDIETIKKKYGDVLKDDYSQINLNKQTQELAINELTSELANVTDYNKYQGVLDKYKQYLDSDDFNQLQDAITKQVEDEKLQAEYGITPNTERVPLDQANPKSFGEFADSSGKQASWVNDVITKARRGKVPNGTVIDFNYGAGKPAKYIYINGTFYKTDKKVSKGWSKGLL